MKCSLLPRDGVGKVLIRSQIFGENMELKTPKRFKSSEEIVSQLHKTPSTNDTMLYPWNWAEESQKMELSPNSGCSSPEFAIRHESKRGRPRADAITNLMVEGSTSPSAIKCRFCNRVFPREKSLQAHLRTHTGMSFRGSMKYLWYWL
jgi:hypothetical protein